MSCFEFVPCQPVVIIMEFVSDQCVIEFVSSQPVMIGIEFVPCQPVVIIVEFVSG